MPLHPEIRRLLKNRHEEEVHRAAQAGLLGPKLYSREIRESEQLAKSLSQALKSGILNNGARQAIEREIQGERAVLEHVQRSLNLLENAPEKAKGKVPGNVTASSCRERIRMAEGRIALIRKARAFKV